MRAPRRRRMTGRAVRAFGMVRCVAGTALAVSLERHLRPVTVPAENPGARREVDIVPECDLTDARFFRHLERKPQADRAFGGKRVAGVALPAGERASGVVMARGAIRRGANARGHVLRPAAVTSAAGKVLVPPVLERATYDGSRALQRTILADLCGDGRLGGRCQRGARRHEDDERRSSNGLRDAI